MNPTSRATTIHMIQPQVIETFQLNKSSFTAVPHPHPAKRILVIWFMPHYNGEWHSETLSHLLSAYQTVFMYTSRNHKHVGKITRNVHVPKTYEIPLRQDILKNSQLSGSFSFNNYIIQCYTLLAIYIDNVWYMCLLVMIGVLYAMRILKS